MMLEIVNPGIDVCQCPNEWPTYTIPVETRCQVDETS